jgi:hypothetical protein
MVTAKSDERTAFWDTCGALDQSEDAVWRQRIYEARHLGAIWLERHRLGNTEGVEDSYAAMAPFDDLVGEVSGDEPGRQRRDRREVGQGRELVAY